MRQLATRVGLVLLVAAVCGLVALHLRQIMMRNRMSRLREDVLTLQRGGDWVSVQRFLRVWASSGRSFEGCTESKCDYTVWVENKLPDAPDFVYEDSHHWVGRIWDYSGLRSSAAKATLHVEGRQLTDSSFGLEIALPVRDWMLENGTYWPEIAAGFRKVKKVPLWNRGETRLKDHEIYMRRIWLEAVFTTETPLSEQRDLTNLQFACVAQWTPCRKRAQIGPQIEAEWETKKTTSSDP